MSQLPFDQALPPSVEPELPNPGERVRVPGIDRPLWVRQTPDGRTLIDEISLEPTPYQYGDEVQVVGPPGDRRVIRAERAGPHPTVWLRFKPHVTAAEKEEMARAVGQTLARVESDDDRMAIVMPHNDLYLRKLFQLWTEADRVEFRRISPQNVFPTRAHLVLYVLGLLGPAIPFIVDLVGPRYDWGRMVIGGWLALSLAMLGGLTIPVRSRFTMCGALSLCSAALAFYMLFYPVVVTLHTMGRSDIRDGPVPPVYSFPNR